MRKRLSLCACEVNLAGMKPGDSIAALRCGPIRLSTPDVADNSGAASRVAADIVKERVKMPPRLAATDFTNILGT